MNNQDLHVMLVRIDSNVSSLLEMREDHETRLRKLERFKSWLAGILALIGSGLGIQSSIQHQ